MTETLVELQHRIASEEARLAVIGLGYVGLAVATAFADAGFDVLGVEVRPDRVAKVNAGLCPFEGEEPGLADALASAVRAGKLRATGDYAALRDRDVVFVNVETPVDDHHVPRYDALRSALLSLGPVLKVGALVIIESTISPGTMDRLVRPLLEEATGRRLNDGFFLGACPERVMPGKLLANLRSLSRVVGGMTAETAETMAALYRHVVRGDLDLTDCVTAELVKTAENAYRDVQIAFANELAVICEAVGADAWRVRELVNKSPGRNVLLPGAGVGGHCIPKDPWLLAAAVGGNAPLIRAAREVNDGMPLHVADLVADALRTHGLSVSGSRIAVLGYAYLEDSDDTRNSPSEVLVARLREWGAEVVVHDPYVAEYQGDVLERVRGCDAVVVMVAHRAYRGLDLVQLREALRTPIVVDGRRVLNAEQAQAAGLAYLRIGTGRWLR